MTSMTSIAAFFFSTGFASGVLCGIVGAVMALTVLRKNTPPPYPSVDPFLFEEFKAYLQAQTGEIPEQDWIDDLNNDLTSDRSADA